MILNCSSSTYRPKGKEGIMPKNDYNPKMVDLLRSAMEKKGMPVKSERGFQFALMDMVTPKKEG